MDEALKAPTVGLTAETETASNYRLSCPDVVEVTVDGRPPTAAAKLQVGPDGRIDLGPLGRPRVEGATVPEVTAAVGQLAGVTPDRVAVRVAGFESQKIYVFGQVNGTQRAVPFRGEETVLDLIHRVGGITPGAEPGAVYVIRPHVADGGRPEIFAVDLAAIVLKRDLKTNLRLEPFDQVYIGETQRASYEKCVPPFLRPLYEAMCGMHRGQTAETTARANAGRGPVSE